MLILTNLAERIKKKKMEKKKERKEKKENHLRHFNYKIVFLSCELTYSFSI